MRGSRRLATLPQTPPPVDPRQLAFPGFLDRSKRVRGPFEATSEAVRRHLDDFELEAEPMGPDFVWGSLD